MTDKFKYVIEAAAGAALAFALILVFLVDFALTMFGGGPGANTLEGVNVTEMGSKHGDSKRLKLGVTPTGEFGDAFSKKVEKWDDMGKLLDELGAGYRDYDKVSIDALIANPKSVHDYDVLFLTCNGGHEEGLKDVLRNYVSEGGILYASDWRFAAVARAFPDVVANGLIGQGAQQELEADIVDPALSDALKTKKITLKFDLGEWKTAAFAGPRVKTLMQGTYRKQKMPLQLDAGVATAPLMVKFQVGKGTVIFTSFHNEKQNSRIEKQLLQYLVFSLVTAGIDSDINSSLDQGGFSARGSNLLSTPKRNQTITKQYDNKTNADLRFALGFRNEGAKLRFNIKSPDGRQYTWEGTSTVILEVANAKAGQWTYSVTDLQLPYENFPFTVTVGEKK